jgi:hypothetical protein
MRLPHPILPHSPEIQENFEFIEQEVTLSEAAKATEKIEALEKRLTEVEAIAKEWL